MSSLQSLDGARKMSGRLALTGCLIALAALAFRSQQLDGSVFIDEYYHLLAARGWLETGRPTILDGEYIRTLLFTGAVAELFRLTGSDAIATGRLLSVVAGVLLPPIMFFWVRAWAGWAAGLIAAGLTVLWPEGIEEAQRLRFYSWQVLFATVGAIAVFQAFEGAGPVRQRLPWIALAVPAFVAALYLQVTTAFALAAILAWICLVHILPWILGQRRRWLWIGFGAAAGLLLIGAAWTTGVLDKFWAQYRWVPGWSAGRADNPGYYHGLLREDYPTFWPLLPFAAILAFRAQPRLALFALAVFGVGFVTLSFGGMKALRYLSYGMPFFFLLIALAIPELVALLGRPVRAVLGPYEPGWLAAAAVTGATVFALAANPFFDRSLDALRGRPPYRTTIQDWSGLHRLLDDWVTAPYVVTTRDLQVIAVLGDYDVLLNSSRMTELPPFSAFVLDPRTGRPVIDDRASVEAILACRPEGVFLTEAGQWENQGLKDDLMPAFEASGRRIETRARGGLVALRWSGGTASAEACALLPKDRGAAS